MIQKVKQFSNQAFFNLVHKNNLIYNTCWEDPRLDREAMKLGENDEIMMITSAGCNALDYLLDKPRHIYCVDMNPKQNALLALKVAGLRTLEYPDFFEMFGRGRLKNFSKVYIQKLRPQLDEYSQNFWDKRLYVFDPERGKKTFYHCGTSGFFAQMVGRYIDWMKLRDLGLDLFNSDSLESQRRTYEKEFRDRFFTGFLKWAMKADATLALLGVPRPQRDLIDQQYTGGIAKFIEDCLDYIFTQIPLSDNYFWWLYFNGSYVPERCPEYLKEDNFEKLRAGLTDRLSWHTSTLLDFLRQHDKPLSRLVLLDHMDWLSAHRKDILAQQWQEIFDHARTDHSSLTRILWRSGGPKVDFVDPIEIQSGGGSIRLGEVLKYHPELAKKLHLKDRVHTYGSFYIADLKRAA